MVTGLHHVGRAVADLDATAADLAAMTTWPVERADAAGDPLVAGRAVTGTARAAGPNGWIELIHVAGPAAPRREVNEPGLTHASIQVPEIDDVVARLDEHGIDRHPGPIELGTGYQYLYVRDAEHLTTEIEGARHARRDLEPWLSHGAITTTDLDRLRTAYEGLLLRPARATIRLRDHPAFDRGTELDGVDVTVTWVPTHNATVELWQYHAPPTGPNPGFAYEQPGAGHLAFETDDLETDLVRASAVGFDLADPPFEQDGVQLARVLDPDGNWVEMIRFLDGDDPRSLRARPDLGRVAAMDALLQGGGR